MTSTDNAKQWMRELSNALDVLAQELENPSISEQGVRTAARNVEFYEKQVRDNWSVYTENAQKTADEELRDWKAHAVKKCHKINHYLNDWQDLVEETIPPLEKKGLRSASAKDTNPKEPPSKQLEGKGNSEGGAASDDKDVPVTAGSSEQGNGGEGSGNGEQEEDGAGWEKVGGGEEGNGGEEEGEGDEEGGQEEDREEGGQGGGEHQPPEGEAVSSQDLEGIFVRRAVPDDPPLIRTPGTVHNGVYSRGGSHQKQTAGRGRGGNQTPDQGQGRGKGRKKNQDGNSYGRGGGQHRPVGQAGNFSQPPPQLPAPPRKSGAGAFVNALGMNPRQINVHDYLPKQGEAFILLDFPENWVLPTRDYFHAHYSYIDILPMLGKKYTCFGFFEGDVESFPSWQETFYTTVHIQNTQCCHKATAFDQAVSPSIRKKLFKNLGKSPQEYLLRIIRMEETYGSKAQQLGNMVEKISEIRKIHPRSPAHVVQSALYALERFLFSNLCPNPQDEYVAHMIKPYMQEALRENYETYRLDYQRPDNAVVVADYLRRLIRVKRQVETKESRYSEKPPTKKKESKTAKNKVTSKQFQFTQWEEGSDNESESLPSSDEEWESSSEESDGERTEIHTSSSKRECAYCSGQHDLYCCAPFFCDITSVERLKWVTTKGKCLLCLGSSHMAKECKSNRTCRFCGGAHNSCVHVDQKPRAGKPAKKAKKKSARQVVKASEDTDEESRSTNQHFVSKNLQTETSVSLSYGVVTAENPNTGKRMDLNVLTDQGADTFSLQGYMARSLGLSGKTFPLTVCGHGNHEDTFQTFRSKLNLYDEEGKLIRMISVNCYDSPISTNAVNWQKAAKKFEQFKSLSPRAPVGDGKVHLILGTPGLDLIEAREPVTFTVPGGPVAKRTAIGWVFGGPTDPSLIEAEGEGTNCFMMRTRMNYSQSLGAKALREREMEFKMQLDEERTRHKIIEQKQNKELERFWEWEDKELEKSLSNSYSPPVLTNEEIKAREHFYKTLKHEKEGDICQAGLMWKGKARPKDNTKQALKQFLRAEKRMKSGDGGSWAHFSEKILEWLEKGYLIELHEKDTSKGFVIPTFVVVREDKQTTKFRLVCNGAAEFDGCSLNQFLRQGPNVMNSLEDVLIRFRYFPYVFTNDVGEMFLKVEVAPEDRKYLRFFFRKPDGKLVLLEAQRHIFGLCSSPFTAMESVRTKARSLRGQYPKAARAVLKDAIVDDILSGSEREAQLPEIKRGIEAIYSSLGMSLHKWASNSSSLRKLIPEKDLATQVSIGVEEDALFNQLKDDLPSIKCLGLLWHPSKDRLQFFAPPVEQEIWTMRETSSLSGQTFDPLGLISPAALDIRRLVQRTWRERMDWDDFLPAPLNKEMNQWVKTFQKIYLCDIPRRVSPFVGKRDEQLLICVDASQHGIAAAAYLKSQQNDLVDVKLWAAKLKIPSLSKQESIARNELMAAVLGVMLGAKICKAMNWDLGNATLFTDSTTVLWWLIVVRELSVFVANRVTRIKDRTRIDQWRYIPTKENCADIPTRGLSATQLADCKPWWEGADFFREPRSEWPQQPQLLEERMLAAQEEYRSEEQKRLVVNWTMVSISQDCKSSDEYLYSLVAEGPGPMGKRMRIAALILKFAQFCKKKPLGVGVSLRLVEQAVTRCAQSFEREKLKERPQLKGGEIRIPDEFKQLKPELDKTGCLRARGRLQYAKRLKAIAKTPLVFHHLNPYAKKYVTMIHEEVLEHVGGKKDLMGEVQRRVWIIGLARLARQVLSECTFCEKEKISIPPVVLPEAPLHMRRIPLPESCSFSEVLVDLAGPFSVRNGNTRAIAKRYLIIFTCYWSRATSIQVMHDESSLSCWMAFERHCSNWGAPRLVCSDQGKHFEGIKNDLLQHWIDLRGLLKEVESKHPQIEWQWIPPFSPRFTGGVEQYVFLAKKTLKKLVAPQNKTLTDEEFLTVVAKTQGYLNMRPLTIPSQDFKDKTTLTPSDFIGSGSRFLEMLPLPPVKDLTSRLWYTQRIFRNLWDALQVEFISYLQRYKRKTRGETEIKVGDFVHILDRKLPTGHYAVGRVQSTVDGPDDVGRQFIVETEGTVDVKNKKSTGQLVRRSGMTLAPFKSLNLVQDESREELD